MKQTFVLDTNVLLDDPNAFDSYQKCKIVIPFKVIEELDKHKSAVGQLGGNARAAIRSLDKIAKAGDLAKGVLVSGNTILVQIWNKACEDALLKHELEAIPDNLIIAAGLLHKNAIMVSNDLAMRIKANTLGMKTQPHSKDGRVNSVSDIYSGLVDHQVSEENINSLYAMGELDMPKKLKLFENQYVHLQSTTNEKHTAVGRVLAGKICRVEPAKDVFGIKPRNLEQVAAFDALLDPELSLVSLLGQAGTGKTIIALAAAMELVLHQHQYKKLVLVRSPTSVGESVGWLPGTLQEKMAPHFEAFMDNLEIIFKAENHTKLQDLVQHLIEDGHLEFTPPTFMRGRSMPKTLLLVDECQNMSAHEVKTLATRLGEGSKLIMIGDLAQIDQPKLDALSNGFTKIIEAFKEQDCAAHITLSKCERSSFASLAAELL